MRTLSRALVRVTKSMISGSLNDLSTAGKFDPRKSVTESMT